MDNLQDANQSEGVGHTPTIASVETHSMGKSLSRYLRMKVHPDIQYNDWERIVVKGYHSRVPPSRISASEKTDKPFNWQRPTTSHNGQKNLELYVFPGEDYVEHYAAIVATYLSLAGKDPNIVTYHLPTPTQCMQPLLESNLSEMGHVDIVVLGYVDRLRRFTYGTWEGGNDDELFSWQIKTLPNGCRIAFLGCRICYWGDIGGNVVRALQSMNKVKCTLYIGKLGSLRPEHKPNTLLATGNSSMVRGSMVNWKNLLEDSTSKSAIVQRGVHYSLPSVLQETHRWTEDRKGLFDWVDPEIGHMAQASVDGGTSFGYLHIVSDNIAHKYQWDLSNERAAKVLDDRKRLSWVIEDILSEFFREWESRTGK
ncbi:Nn.00g076090.m01.CDS01 [Neocucurbitaria sp. VM-36]